MSKEELEKEEFDEGRIKSRIEHFVHEWITKTNDINMNVGLLALVQMMDNAINWDDCSEEIQNKDYDLSIIISDVMKKLGFKSFDVMMDVFYNISLEKIFKHLETFSFHNNSSILLGKLLRNIEHRDLYGILGKKE